jgi:peroxiredoxin Q/BCP
MLTINQSAPNFSLYDAHDILHKLDDYKGHWLVIYFYPKFENLNTRIIGISTDSSKSHLNFSQNQNLNFTLLADPKGEVSKAYEALFKLGPVKFSKRHSFIIDPTGKIAKIYRSVSPSTHSQELIDDLQQLQTEFKR